MLSHSACASYFRVGFATFAAAIGGFWLLLGNPRHDFIDSGKTINHREEPSPEIQMPLVGNHPYSSTTANYIALLPN